MHNLRKEIDFYRWILFEKADNNVKTVQMANNNKLNVFAFN